MQEKVSSAILNIYYNVSRCYATECYVMQKPCQNWHGNFQKATFLTKILNPITTPFSRYEVHFLHKGGVLKISEKTAKKKRRSLICYVMQVVMLFHAILCGVMLCMAWQKVRSKNSSK